jgi:ankyrin repeat protein
MPTFECVCGYSCGSEKAWFRHAGREGTHTLLDPTLLQQGDAENSGAAPAALVRFGASPSTSQQHFSLDSGKLQRSLQHESMPIIDAARHGDTSRLASLLGASPVPSAADLGRLDASGMSAIAWASKAGRCEVVSMLLDARASPNLSPSRATDATEEAGAAASEAHPPLYLALTKGRFDVARLLLDAGARPLEAEPVRRQTALHAACSTDAPLEVVNLLMQALRRDAEVRAGDTNLDDLDEGDCGDDGKEASAGATPATTVPVVLPADNEGCTPLHSACATGKADCVRRLLASSDPREELRRQSLKRATPLAAACRRRHAEVAVMLVRDYAAALDPLAVHLCLAKGEAGLLEELLRERRDGDGAGPAGTSGVDACFADTGVSALMMAAETGDDAAVSQLLELGADAGAADSDGQTALMRAAFYGHTKVVGHLIKAGCAVDAADREGNTALHHAGRGAQEFVFDLLEMRYGADSDLKNRSGETPKLNAEPCRVQ